MQDDEFVEHGEYSSSSQPTIQRMTGGGGGGGSSRVTIISVAIVSAIIGGLIAGLVLPAAVPGLYQFNGSQQPAQHQSVTSTHSNSSTSSAQVTTVDNPPSQTTVESVAQHVGRSVVGVVATSTSQDPFTGQSGSQKDEGSGVVFKYDKSTNTDYIVTNYHVVKGADKVQVSIGNNNNNLIDAQIVGKDAPTDLAVLKIKGHSLPPVGFANINHLQIGETLIAIGNPIGLEGSVTAGVLSGIRNMTYGQDPQMQRVFRVIQTDAAINPGNSGGALVDANGNLVGINTFKIAGVKISGIGFAIPSDTVKRIADQLVQYGYVKRAELGVQILTQDQVSQYLNKTLKKGAYIYGVQSGTPAAKAGLQRGDIITKFNGQPINKVADLMKLMEKAKPGDRVKLTIKRNGKTQLISVTLAQMPGPHAKQAQSS